MLVSKVQYAEICGCTPQNIYNRIKSGIIKTKTKVLPDGSKEEYIDTKKFPPSRIRKEGGGRKKGKKRSKK